MGLKPQYRLVAGGPRTGLLMDRYILPVPGGTVPKLHTLVSKNFKGSSQGWQRGPSAQQEGYGTSAVLPDQGIYLAASVYRPVLQVAGTWTAHYRAVPPKIDHRRSILVVDGRLREKLTVGGRLSEKKGRRRRRRGKEEKKKEEKKKEYLAPARRRRPWVAGAFSPAWGERSRRLSYRYRDELGTPVRIDFYKDCYVSWL
ncbi:hypothetical protein GW17_00052069 [Ensete ventricosum]|nr:hypothetical protein GW17_00052069 [Ensete ventricosum]